MVRGLGLRLTVGANRPGTATFTPDKAGDYPITCSMNMYRGATIRVV